MRKTGRTKRLPESVALQDVGSSQGAKGSILTKEPRSLRDPDRGGIKDTAHQ
jgi:hypothetical protein